jgi:hypothetical protein
MTQFHVETFFDSTSACLISFCLLKHVIFTNRERLTFNYSSFSTGSMWCSCRVSFRRSRWWRGRKRDLCCIEARRGRDRCIGRISGSFFREGRRFLSISFPFDGPCHRSRHLVVAMTQRWRELQCKLKIEARLKLIAQGSRTFLTNRHFHFQIFSSMRHKISLSSSLFRRLLKYYEVISKSREVETSFVGWNKRNFKEFLFHEEYGSLHNAFLVSWLLVCKYAGGFDSEELKYVCKILSWVFLIKSFLSTSY